MEGDVRSPLVKVVGEVGTGDVGWDRERGKRREATARVNCIIFVIMVCSGDRSYDNRIVQ